MENREFIPSRLDFEVIAFCNCTMKEMQIIALASLVGCVLVLGFLTEILFGMFLIGVGIAFPATVGVTWFIAKLFQRAKQGKPKGYLKKKILLWLEDHRIMKSPYIRHSGKWSVGRRVNLK